MKRLTALHQAAFDGNLELVKLLVELGADQTIQDRSYNATPLGWAEHKTNARSSTTSRSSNPRRSRSPARPEPQSF